MDAVKAAALKKYIQDLKDDEMRALAMVESSGGQNLQHPMVTKGLNAGYTAGGPWGLMPVSAAETDKKDTSLAQKYPDFHNLLQDPASNKEQITQMLNDNPELAYDYSKSQFRRNLNKFNDLPQAVHSWYYGPSGTMKTMKEKGPEAIQNADYVKKFNEYYKPELPQEEVAQNPEEDFEKVKKLITQGY